MWVDYSHFLFMRSELGFRKPDTRRVWRWEQAVFDLCAKSPRVTELVGNLYPTCHWPEVAQERDFWQLLEAEFFRSTRCKTAISTDCVGGLVQRRFT